MNNHWKNNYVESMEQMKFTEKQQERMVDFMLNQAKEKHTSDTRRRIPFGAKRLAAAGICLSIITAGTAVAHAAGILNPVSEVFREIFHLEKETVKITDEIGSSLNISDTSNDVSITADAVLGDSYNFAVVFSIQKKDGKAFKKTDLQALADEQNNTIGFREMHIGVEKPNGNQRGNFHFYDSNSDDASLQMLYTCATDTDNSIGASVIADFTDFGYYNPYGSFIPVARGNWKVTFSLDYTDSSRQFDPNRKIEQNGNSITVKKISISPVGFHIELNIKNLKSQNKIYEVDSIIERLPLKLVLTDGKEINLNKKLNGFTILEEDGTGTYVSCGNAFREIIPADQMKSLCIGDLILDF